MCIAITSLSLYRKNVSNDKRLRHCREGRSLSILQLFLAPPRERCRKDDSCLKAERGQVRNEKVLNTSLDYWLDES